MAGFTSVTGSESIMFADNCSFDGTERGGAMTTNGQLWIGSTASPHVAKGTLTSPLGTLAIGYSAPNITLDLVGGITAVEHLTGDSGGTLNPDGANNFNLLGQQAGAIPVMDTIGSGATIKFEDRTWPTKFVVDGSTTVGLRATYSTIASAIAAASSGDTIFIRPGTYTENLTMKAGVNLTAWQSDGNGNPYTFTNNVTIIGTVTMTVAGTAVLSGIRLQTNSAAVVSVTGTAASILTLKNCYLNCTNNSGIVGSSTLANINLLGCGGDLGTTGINFFTLTNGTNIYFDGGLWSTSGSSLTASTWTNGIVTINNCSFSNPITSSGASGGSGTLSNVMMSGFTNTTAITQNGTNATLQVYNCQIFGGTASAITVGAGATLNLYNAVVSSSNTNAITGSGTLNYANIIYASSSSKINTTTATLLLASDFQKVVVQTFTSNGTYTPTAGMKYCTIEVVGGGGGGAGTPLTGASQVATGGGGGAGGYSRKTATAAAIGTSQVVTVGAGGAGGTGNASGSNGTASSVGAIVVSGLGGGGSNAGAAITSVTAGGQSTSGSSGDFNAPGGIGGNGFGAFGTTTSAMGGTGGQSIFGGCSNPNVVNAGTANGNAGIVYGGGGGGAASGPSNAAANGGTGAAGIVIVTEYL